MNECIQCGVVNIQSINIHKQNYGLQMYQKHISQGYKIHNSKYLLILGTFSMKFDGKHITKRAESLSRYML